MHEYEKVRSNRKLKYKLLYGKSRFVKKTMLKDKNIFTLWYNN